jgi:hypothetical protein
VAAVASSVALELKATLIMLTPVGTRSTAVVSSY